MRGTARRFRDLFVTSRHSVNYCTLLIITFAQLTACANVFYFRFSRKGNKSLYDSEKRGVFLHKFRYA